jgi:CheY-like chemotaxis protein
LIVLAEDNAELRQLLGSGLARVGFTVVQAINGADLVETVRRLRDIDEVALIVTDVRMPIMDGVAAVQALRATGVTTPVIFMTAFGDLETRRAMERLNSHWIDKPVGVVSLRLAVADVLGLAPILPSRDAR